MPREADGSAVLKLYCSRLLPSRSRLFTPNPSALHVEVPTPSLNGSGRFSGQGPHPYGNYAWPGLFFMAAHLRPGHTGPGPLIDNKSAGRLRSLAGYKGGITHFQCQRDRLAY